MIGFERPIATLRIFHLLSLALAWCFGIVGAATCINGIVALNTEKNTLKQVVPPPIIVSVNTQDIDIPSRLAATFCIIIFVVTSIALVLSVIHKRSSRSSMALLAILLTLLSVCLLGCIIAETAFFTMRDAKVIALLNGTQIPDSVVKSIQKSLGVIDAYKSISYLRNAIILQWLAFLFTMIAVIILIISAVSLDKQKKREFEVSNSHPLTLYGEHSISYGIVSTTRERTVSERGSGSPLAAEPIFGTQASSTAGNVIQEERL